LQEAAGLRSNTHRFPVGPLKAQVLAFSGSSVISATPTNTCASGKNTLFIVYVKVVLPDRTILEPTAYRSSASMPEAMRVEPSASQSVPILLHSKTGDAGTDEGGEMGAPASSIFRRACDRAENFQDASHHMSSEATLPSAPLPPAPPPPAPPSASYEAAASTSEAPAAEADVVHNTLTKTEVSQNLKGSQSYYYWHADAERRRMAGEKPVPASAPPKIATHVETTREKPVKGISTFSFLDDDNVVKIYIALEGELAGLSIDQVASQFTDRSLLLSIELPGAIHRFAIDRLMFPVDETRCKVSINKGKLLVRLFKRDHHQHWVKLRAA